MSESKARRPRYTEQPLFQDGSDLPLFTGYNPQPEPKRRAATAATIATHTDTPSLPVYHLTRVVEFYPNPPDRWEVLAGEPVAVGVGTFVTILRASAHVPDLFLVEHEGRYAWTYWVAAV